jgi:hypothetical protein
MTIIAAILFAAAIGGGLFYLNRRRMAQPSTFKRRRPLSSAEQTLYWRLVNMLPDHVVLPQVPFTRCLVIKGPALEILRTERLDFVICSKSMQVLAAIELVPDKEDTPRREKYNLLLDEAFCQAGIRLIRWPANPVPSEAFIAMELDQYTVMQPLAA